MAKGQQELPPSEHHFRWLLYLSVVVVAIGIGFLVFVQLTQPFEFNEDFARDLIERHDPSLSEEQFDAEQTEEENGEIRNDRKFIGLVRDNGSIVAVREAIVTVDPEEDNKTISSTYTFVGSKPLDVGEGRSWSCPFDTYHNISTEVTDQYYYIGLVSNYIPIALFQDFLQEQATFSEEFNETFSYDPSKGPFDETVTLESLLAQSTGTDYTQVWYFSPDERAEYESQLAELLEIDDICVEVSA